MGYVKEVSILGIVVLEAIALLNGINGTMFTMCVAVIAGIAGYGFRIQRNKEDNYTYKNLPGELME